MLLIAEVFWEHGFVALIPLTLLMNIVYNTKLFPKQNRYVIGFFFVPGEAVRF